MLVISSREFREKQKMYLDMVDKNEQIIVRRGKNRAYTLTPITETDRFFADPKIRERLVNSLNQVEQGETITLKKEDINKLLGL